MGLNLRLLTSMETESVMVMRANPPSSLQTAGLLPGESTCHGTSEDVSSISSHHKQEEMSPWFLSKKEIEDNSPSRRDGISLKRENYLRKSYCIFLRELGKSLKVSQMTIATAILFCHRFFLRNSHSKNDRMIIATVCMFLAGKVEETPRPLQDVILVSYEIVFKKDPEAAERIKQKEVYEQRKEIILTGEKLVLDTLGFDLTVGHPYKPLIEAAKKLKITQNYVPKIAWNFVNDGLMTTLSLQFKPCQIAAGAIFLAAKFLKVKLPSENLLQELHVNPRQLEEISNQMLDLYYPRREPPPHRSEVEAGSVGVSFHLTPPKMAAVNENINNEKQVGEAKNKDQNCDGPPDPESNLNLPDISRPGTEQGEEDKGKTVLRNETATMEELGNDSVSRESGDIVGPNSVWRETSRGSIEIDGGEVQGELEKTKKVHTEMTREKDKTTEGGSVEIDLEESVRLVAECDQDKMCRSKTDEEDFDETGMEKADNMVGNKEGIVGNGRR